MDILTYVTETDFQSKKQLDKASLLLYYDYKENGNTVFRRSSIHKLFSDAGESQKLNLSRIMKTLKNAEYIRPVEKGRGYYELVPIHLQRMERAYERLWLGLQFIDSSSEIINETRYCGKRDAIDKLIKQINCCYAQHCFDACLVLMRRLFEILLILCYQEQGIDDEIKDDKGNYQLLNSIVKNAKTNKTLKLSRNKLQYDSFRKLGNYSAHNIYYVGTAKEVDEIKLDYKAMMDELYEKAGLLK